MKAVCFDTLLQVLILKDVSREMAGTPQPNSEAANSHGQRSKDQRSEANAETCLRQAGAENAEERGEETQGNYGFLAPRLRNGTQTERNLGKFEAYFLTGLIYKSHYRVFNRNLRRERITAEFHPRLSFPRGT